MKLTKSKLKEIIKEELKTFKEKDRLNVLKAKGEGRSEQKKES